MAQKRSTASAARGAARGSGAAQRFLEVYRGEHERTRKVLRAYPAKQSELRPHERSNNARQIAWTFVIEERMMSIALRGEQVLGSGFPPAPDSWDAILDEFDSLHEEVVRQLENANEQATNGSVTFFVAPKKTGDFGTMQFLWFLLHDQIHHRGQLSVYLRLAGGKVPAIYGPSADEPWF